MANIENVKYLIIGNSAGGVGAAEAIRLVDKSGTIAIVSDEPYPAYSRPLISEYLAERCPLERMLFRPADFYAKQNIRALLDTTVERIDIASHSVHLANNREITWEKLLLATGGSPIVPRIEGIELKGVFTFATLGDAKLIDQFLIQYPRRARAVIIGGGLIGISVTEALVKRGVEVTVVEMKDRVLNTILDEEASALVDQVLRQAGVEIVVGQTVAKVRSYSAGDTTSVILDNSRPIPCELVIAAIGVRPRTELAVAAGIKVNRGIIVDRHMATSIPDIYACGDAAEAYDFIYGENRLTPVWPNAYLGGRVAGFNMAGKTTEYPGGTAMNSLSYFGLAVISAGIISPPDSSYEILNNRHGSTYKKVVLKDGYIVGMVFIGDIEKSGIVFSLMKDRIKVDDFKKSLVADDFGLASLPEEIWRARIRTPSSLVTLAKSLKEELVRK
ncbi:MAG: FAD-dependent pyridine nucleotide-disulfide oxidoreductase [Dehalococcoidales bacterium]|nr:FAD-dependent pyridine nucleotide-disulfide oxidoreductase [Dehalococcoidales bacterium]